jgi:hypothetical protein
MWGRSATTRPIRSPRSVGKAGAHKREAMADLPVRSRRRRPHRSAGHHSCRGRTHEKGGIGRQVAVVLYVLALVAVVVSADVLFFRHRSWERLMVNAGIVLVFVAFYLRFPKRP